MEITLELKYMCLLKNRLYSGNMTISQYLNILTGLIKLGDMGSSAERSTSC